MFKITKGILLGLCFVILQGSITVQITQASANNNDHIEKNMAIKMIRDKSSNVLRDTKFSLNNTENEFLNRIDTRDDTRDYLRYDLSYKKLRQENQYIVIDKLISDVEKYSNELIDQLERREQDIERKKVDDMIKNLVVRQNTITTKLEELNKTLFHDENFRKSFIEAVDEAINKQQNSDINGTQK